ncbi:MAG: hypothetical protein Q4C13_03810 [Clostridia bacterium]|nr:hypothetical protein [Clostridia bacterium]
MRILVLLKQVPASDVGGMDAAIGLLRRDQGEKRVNPHDAAALEAGLRLREAAGGTLELMSMGPPSAREALAEALALGADAAALLCGEGFRGADVLATARALAAACRLLGPYDALLCGAFTTDGGTGHTPGTLAALLGLPYYAGVEEVAASPGGLLLTQTLTCTRQKLLLCAPAVLAIAPEAYRLRLPTLPGRLAARSRPVRVLPPEALALPPEALGLAGSPTRVVRVETLRRGPAAPPISGEARDMAERIYACFREAPL